MRVGVVVFPGTNCDMDTYHALRLVGHDPVYLWHKEHDLKNVDVVILPGGFSYGDYLRAGAIARFSPIMNEIIDFAKKGGYVLGICNGFQILLEAGLLPGAMLPNITNSFICKEVFLEVINNNTLFLKNYKVGEILKMPIAHKEGRYYISKRELEELKENNQIVLKYYGENPNGSLENIAGIINKKGNVMGLMPHPERAVEEILGSTSGLNLFLTLLE
ncbi:MULTISPECIES: phosphoribosylformylglycinamidine synthase subunit PurQ [Dictyoglomus]|uniref:Phosphoribosylformylglycinamidine synthase subunit PurQ n=1 Tax=Dictyoglomus turgidum (strain DSM 6724 / Z-1310) TaxID=515635 RepID=B8E0V8_DICTD|nr:phosphoribosylformylglycinamidine synthase I [Dictyoglomus turgidum DSM 6724]PNV78820.1 MAG: phosphoribosylformylglycinamidine synthase subunit PurQ [Dictyoglomus turgidum]HBU30754.1 phosphoribosylformylglycinamidine synthase subunit PurQ [Dictyoglomus sp.]